MKIDIKGVDRVKEMLTQRAARLKDLTPALAAAGKVLQDLSAQSFATTTDPNTGKKWQKLKPETIKRKKAFGSPEMLVMTGALKSGIIPTVTKTSVKIGVKGKAAKYADAQNFGYAPRNLPARPFIFSATYRSGSMTAKAVKLISSIIKKYILTGSLK